MLTHTHTCTHKCAHAHVHTQLTQESDHIPNYIYTVHRAQTGSVDKEAHFDCHPALVGLLLGNLNRLMEKCIHGGDVAMATRQLPFVLLEVMAGT